MIEALQNQLDEVIERKVTQDQACQTLRVATRATKTQTTGDAHADSEGAPAASAELKRTRTVLANSRRSVLATTRSLNAIKSSPDHPTGPVANLLNVVNEVHEAKLAADRDALMGDSLPIPLNEFIKVYWRQKYRARKAGNKRINWMITATRKHMDHPRVRLFGWLVGMDITMVMNTEFLYGPMVSRMFYAFLSEVVNGDPKALRPLLDAGVLPLECVLAALIGLGLEGVSRADARTWRCTHMKKMMPDRIIEEALVRIEARASLDEVPQVAFDDVTRAIMDTYNDALLRHKTELTKAFYIFDEGREGMSLDEFRELVKWAVGSYRCEIMSEEELSDIYHHIEELADEDDDDENIDEGENFAYAVIMCDIDLSYSKYCRNHWSLPSQYTAQRYGTNSNALAMQELSSISESAESALDLFAPKSADPDKRRNLSITPSR